VGRTVAKDGTRWSASFHRAGGCVVQVLLCDILAQGLIGLIGYAYQQGIPSFPETHLKKNSRLSVLGLERFDDG
jgi:hypothetical protein